MRFFKFKKKTKDSVLSSNQKTIVFKVRQSTVIRGMEEHIEMNTKMANYHSCIANEP